MKAISSYLRLLDKMYHAEISAETQIYHSEANEKVFFCSSMPWLYFSSLAISSRVCALHARSSGMNGNEWQQKIYLFNLNAQSKAEKINNSSQLLIESILISFHPAPASLFCMLRASTHADID
jgi:hypothetical protein